MTLLDSQLDVVYAAGEPTPNVPDYYGQARRALRAARPRSARCSATSSSSPSRCRSPAAVRPGAAPRLDYVASAFDVVQNAFIEAAAAGLLVALLLGIGLTTTLLRRLERLRDATRELERRGPDGQPAAPGSAPRRDRRAGARVREDAARLRRQEAARRAFVATASHELRTPLASLDGMLELLEDDLNAEHLDLEDARERTARAREQSRRLSQLATDLLDLSRLDAEVALRSEPLELGEICRAVAAEFELRGGGDRSKARLEVHRPRSRVGHRPTRARSRASCAS